MRVHEIDLPTLRQTRPTPFDRSPADFRACEDRGAWLVCPCSQTRDSDALERSNFEAQASTLAVADPSGEDYEVHRFGHWGPGWYEIAIVRPDSKAHRAAREIAAALASYPVLDDDAFSQLEWDEAIDNLDARDLFRRVASPEAVAWIHNRMRPECLNALVDACAGYTVIEGGAFRIVNLSRHSDRHEIAGILARVRRALK